VGDAGICGGLCERYPVHVAGVPGTGDREEDDAINIRIIKGQTQPGKVDELAKRWKEFFGPLAKDNRELRHAYLAGDLDGNTALAVTVWEKRPDDATLEHITEQGRERVSDISAGPPTIDLYEVVAEL
jgi:hypothetical protein